MRGSADLVNNMAIQQQTLDTLQPNQTSL